VSLIETALEKLRRSADADAESRVVVSRPIGLPAVAPKPSPLAAHHPLSGPKRLAIDIKALRAAGYLPEEGLERRFADHYRQIKRPLVENALTGPADMRLIVVTSALPGDGKTFTSINLALSMARERDLSVLLIDADTPKARISEIFGIRRERGLLDALVDESLDVEELIAPTDVPGLEVLSAGRFLENTTELLASARMGQIAARISARNPRRLVLFDTAPLLVSSEARVLLRIAGQVVLVARVGATPRHAVVEALAQVDKKKLQGLILNNAPFRKGGGYYEYGGYGAKGEGKSAESR
jgi:protein-tyrosine kinase